MSDGRRVYVEQPDIVRTKRGLALLGQPTWIWPVADSVLDERSAQQMLLAPRLAGVVVDSQGVVASIVMPPSGTVVMQDVRTLADSGGLAHVFWGVPSSDSSVARPPVTSLWYASFDGDSWTRPEQVLDVDRIFMGRTTVAVREAQGSLHVVAVVSDQTHSPSFRQGIQYARRSADGVWRARWIDLGPHGGAVRYVALLAPQAGHDVLIAFTGSVNASSEQTGAHGLYVVRSRDGGASWESPFLVRTLDGNSGYFLDALRGVRGQLFLQWTSLPQAVPGAARRGAVVHLTSSANGEQWYPLPDLTIHTSAAGRVPMVAAPSGGLYLVAYEAAASRAGLWHWTWPDPSTAGSQTWAQPAAFAPQPAMLTPTLSSPGVETLYLVWGTPHSLAVPGRGTTFIPSTRLATYRTCGAVR